VVRGLHGLGKTAVAAWFILWMITCHGDDTKVPTTASQWRHLEKFLWPEVRKWSAKADWSKLNIKMRRKKEVLDLSIKLNNSEAFAMASDKPSAMEGTHGTNIGFVFDEAKTIPEETFDATAGAFATFGSESEGVGYALAISTPGITSGRFYEMFKDRRKFTKWFPIHVTLEEAIAAGRVSAEWVEEKKLEWGEESGLYKTRVLGDFDDSGEDVLIPIAWVEAANERYYAVNGLGHGQVSYGGDVAREGADKITFVEKVGDVVGPITYKSRQSNTKTTGDWVNLVQYKDDKIAIDRGDGAGVIDRMRELGYAVINVNFGSKANMKDQSGLRNFNNLRSQLWWMMRELLDPDLGATLALAPDDKLTGDLTAPQWWHASNGDIVVEGKKEVRKRLKRSTDSADCVMLACYAPIAPETASNKWEQLDSWDSDWRGG
jgi:hypothetical protein